MGLVSAVTLVLLTFAVGCSADWNGVYDDPIYGGNIYICVSEVGGVFYGQGTFSRLGYMRGIITTSDVFTGSYWLQGWEGTQGSFSLTLTGSAYTGTFTQLPGLTYSISGTKSLSTTPTELECQKSDDYLLTTSEYYSSTGTYVYVGEGNDQGVISNSIVESEAGKGTTVGSYQYVFSSNGKLDHGTEYSNAYLNGQIKAGRWSERDDASGINMYVAKNATHHYTSWWFIQRMADFDYSTSSDPDLEGHGLMEKVDSLQLPVAARDADANVCLELFTIDAEIECYINSNDLYSEDDDDNVAAGVNMSAMAFAVFGFVATLVFGVLILVEVRKRNANAPTLPATTTNELHKDHL